MQGMHLATRARQLSRLGPNDIWRRLTFARIDESLRVRRAMTRRGEMSESEFVIHPRDLHRSPVALRVGTSDPSVAWDTFVGRYHLPPSDVCARPTRIWDLGSNIGLTVAHYANLYPEAQVTGVELDPITAERAVTTIRPWASRCAMVSGAVWYEDGDVHFERQFGREYGTHVGEGEHVVKGYSLNTLFDDDEKIDFVKFDIEGAEAEVLSRNVEWADKVSSMQIEVHDSYTVDDCINDVQRLGFEARRHETHRAAVVAWR